METKQVLVWRKDLRNTEGQKVRTGKIAAQLAHASMAAILNISEVRDLTDQPLRSQCFELNPILDDWLGGRFTKICVSVNSEDELLDIHKQAKDAGLMCSLIRDAGITEFNGVATYTAVAVGPAESEDIDKITGGLKLL